MLPAYSQSDCLSVHLSTLLSVCDFFLIKTPVELISYSKYESLISQRRPLFLDQ